ncbi:MAG: C-GCAxxG-C-C family protein, partial [Bacteroidota bacterium]
TKEKIMQFNQKFMEVHGSLICKELTGYDISTTEGAQAAKEEDVFHKKCPFFIKTACNILAKEI